MHRSICSSFQWIWRSCENVISSSSMLSFSSGGAPWRLRVARQIQSLDQTASGRKFWSAIPCESLLDIAWTQLDVFKSFRQTLLTGRHWLKCLLLICSKYEMGSNGSPHNGRAVPLIIHPSAHNEMLLFANVTLSSQHKINVTPVVAIRLPFGKYTPVLAINKSGKMSKIPWKQGSNAKASGHGSGTRRTPMSCKTMNS